MVADDTCGTPILAVAFDLDDTLLDHGGSARAGIRVWLERRGVACDDDLGDGLDDD